ncbi:SGNH/GDSL hydrolase family protein [Neobacillus sp. NPDC058068]|uniref:SGNH/GDSL hydrolase family protein n=1 Tax=Neobacillus sp. NPDC058068 TaxID=3346325 RepID=UPI0036DC1C42
MKRFFTLLILSALFLSSCSQSDQLALHQEKKAATQVFKPIPADFVPRNFTVLSTGDSLTQGVGDSTNQGGYLPYLKTLLEKEKGIQQVDFFNYGITGNRTTQLLKRLKTPEMKADLQKADMVIITIGGNDIMKVVKENFTNLQLPVFTKEKETFRQHLIQIFEAIVQENPHASIVLVGLYNPFSKWFSDIKEMDEIVSDWNKAGQSVVANYPNAYFVPIEDLFLNTDENLLFTDNFHPNDKGYELIAERLNETLEARVIPDIAKKAFLVTTEEN